MNIIQNLTFELKNVYKKITMEKVLVRFGVLDIDIEDGISMDDIIKFAGDEYRINIKLYYPSFDKVFEFKSENKHKRKMVNLIFMYKGRDEKLELIIDEDLKNSILLGKKDNIRNLVYTFENEIKFGEYAEIECDEFFGRCFRMKTYEDICFEKVNFIYGDRYDHNSGKIKRFSFEILLNELYENFEIVDIDKTNKVVCCNFLGKEYYFVYSIDLKEIKKVCDILKNETGLENFEFNNKNYHNIFDEMYGYINNEEIPKCSYNMEINFIKNEYSCRPLLGKCDVKSNKKFKYGFDVCKSYTSGLMNARNEKIGLINRFDNFKKWNGEINKDKIKLGWYLLDKFKYNVFEFKSMFVPCYFVKYLIDNKIKFEIIGFVESKSYYKVGKICNVIEELYRLFYDRKEKVIERNSIYDFLIEEGDSVEGVKEFEEYYDGNYETELKNIINHYIGTLNCKEYSDKFCFVSNDEKILSMYEDAGYDVEYLLDKKIKRTDGKNGNWMVKNKNKFEYKEDRTLIHNFILCGGMMNFINGFKMVNEKYNIEVNNWNTDGFSFYCDEYIKDINTSCGKSYLEFLNGNCYKIKGNLFKENEGIYIDETYYEKYKNKYKKYRKTKNSLKRRLDLGVPGSGKTFNSLLALKGKKVICLGYSNKSVENMRDYLKLFEMNDSIGMTIHRFLGHGIDGKNENRCCFNYEEYDYIFIDEYFMVPCKLMNSLIDELIDFDGEIIFSGDVYQNGYFIIGDGWKYNYLNCDIFGELVDFKIMEEREMEIGKCRYLSIEMIEFLKEFRKTRKIPLWVKGMINEIDYKCVNSVCRSNKMREFINGKFYDKIEIGAKCILRKNYLDKDFLKGYEFICCGIENDEIFDENGNGFRLVDCDLGYCNTTHFIQGKTYEGDLNIFELNGMTFENAMVAFSRVRDLKNIRIETKFNFDKVFQSEYDLFENIITEEKGNTLYLGKIYFYEDKENKIYYIGQTIRDDEFERFVEHFEKKGWDINKFKVIKKIVGSKNKIDKLEKEYIKKYLEIYGSDLQNIRDTKIKVIKKNYTGNHKVNDKSRYILRLNGERIEIYDTITKKIHKKPRYSKKGLENVKNDLIDYMNENGMVFENRIR